MEKLRGRRYEEGENESASFKIITLSQSVYMKIMNENIWKPNFKARDYVQNTPTNFSRGYQPNKERYYRQNTKYDNRMNGYERGKRYNNRINEVEKSQPTKNNMNTPNRSRTPTMNNGQRNFPQQNPYALYPQPQIPYNQPPMMYQQPIRNFPMNTLRMMPPPQKVQQVG